MVVSSYRLRAYSDDVPSAPSSNIIPPPPGHVPSPAAIEQFDSLFDSLLPRSLQPGSIGPGSFGPNTQESSWVADLISSRISEMQERIQQSMDHRMEGRIATMLLEQAANLVG